MVPKGGPSAENTARETARPGIARGLLLGALLALLQALTPAGAHAQPTDGLGNIGRTNYATLPFMQGIYQLCWGCSPYVEPGELFFQSNPASFFNNAANVATAIAGARYMSGTGIVPMSSQQRWEDTYAASFPAGTFPSAPSWVASDIVTFNGPNDAAFVAWRDFITNHPQYWDIAYDGGTMPPSYRSWGGQWGHISPLTPLDAADCPPGLSSCTWGDLYAYRWGLTAGLTGAYGVALSDFADSQPNDPSKMHDFNPRIIARFAQATGLPVPSGSVATQASWIVANANEQWSDFLSQGYGAFYNALATQVTGETGKQALIIDQCSATPAWRRWVGTDQRLIAQAMRPASYLCIWDSHVMQSDRGGPLRYSPIQELAGAVIAAAREPLMRNGANLEADDTAYWGAMSQFYPTLSASAQTEVGYKLLKRLWLWSAWAHIADRGGKVRRALAFVSRDYWDAGTLTAIDPLTRLIQTIIPAQPFGPALYYSVAVERAYEQANNSYGPGPLVTTYMIGDMLQAYLDKGGVAGYYVSDAALMKIVKGQANAPSAWIVLNANGGLPASEHNRLAAIAPVVTTAAAMQALPNQPLQFTNGLTGFGFYDQTHRLIVVVSNPSTQPTAATIAGAIKLSGLHGPSYTVTDLFANTTSSVTVTGGHATMPVSLTRWDTRAFAFTTP